MSEAVCLRCDWSGATDGSTCPRCGVPLYRSAPAQGGARPAGPGSPVPASAAPSASDEEASPEEPPEAPADVGRSGPWGLLIGMFAAGVALAAVSTWAQPAAPPDGPAFEPPLTRGTLVYAADAGHGWHRLWRLDLSTGRLLRGPRIPRASELRASSGGRGTWVAALSARSRGGKRAYVLRSLSQTGRPTLVARGDLVAWGPNATSLIVADRGPLRDACRRSVRVRFLTVEPRTWARVFERRNLCGDILAVGRDASSTYFSRVGGARPGVYIAGYQAPHLVLPDHAMIAVAFTGGMLVTPSDDVGRDRGIGPFGGHPDRAPPPPVTGRVLYWQGRGDPVPVGDGTAPLSAGRVLAWSRSASHALVAGEFRGALGVFMIETAPTADLEPPRFVIPLHGAVGATFADDGSAFVAMGGRLFVVEGGGPRPISLPEGAPAPAGPIAWVP